MTVHARPFPVLALVASALILMLGATAPNALAQGKTSAEQESPRGPNDGIKVHGHWTIDIKNADGTPASHHEFENALTTDGAGGLSQLLGHGETIIGWGIRIDSGSLAVSSPCNGSCNVIESVATAVSDFPPLLNVTVPTSGPNAGMLVLSASVTAQNPTEVEVVRTFFYSTPSNCQGCSTMHTFSQRTLSPPIQGILTGQVIQVTVVLSFS
jgi:hypothetical protein